MKPSPLFSDNGADARPDALVVDDDPCIAELLALMLAHRGMRVGVAHDGREALRMMALRRPALVLTDFIMPVMDGAALTQAMQRNPALRNVPVVISSGHCEDDLRAGGAVYHAYLRKPVRQDELHAVLSSLVQPVETG